MCGQKVMNGTVANALRVFFHCTCGSLRSLTPGDREGGVFPVSQTWSWRGSRFLMSLTPLWSGGGSLRSQTPEDEGKLPFRSLTSWARGVNLSGLSHLELEGWFFQVSHTWSWRRGVSHVSHTLIVVGGFLRSQTPEDGGGVVFLVATTLKWWVRIFQVFHTLRWRGGSLMSLTPLKWRGNLSDLRHLEVVGEDFSGYSRLELEGEGSFRSLAPMPWDIPWGGGMF